MENRNIRLAIAGIGLGAIIIRLWPLLLPGGPLAYLVNFDEGIYFTTSAHLLRGSLPYRDLFFVHPPGLPLLLTPITYWANHGHVAAAFAATRYLATLVGAGNTVLAGAIALRAFGPLAGISAALMYATFPEAVREERGPFLEPVLNLLGLGMAWLWLWPRSGRRQVVAGFVGGMALAVKTWGAAWVLAALTSLPRRRPMTAALSYLAGLAAGLAILVLPFVLLAPHKFEAQVIGFHLQRGPQGVGQVIPRLWDMNVRHPLTSLFALTGVALALAAIRQRSTREDIHTAGFFTVGLGLSVAAFVVAPIYFHRYASFLAPSAAVLGGFGASWIYERTRIRWPALVPAMLVLTVVSQTAFDVFTLRTFRNLNQPELARAIQRMVPRESPIYALEPGWLILANRLPDAREGVLGGWPGYQMPGFLAAQGKPFSLEGRLAARVIAFHDTQRFLSSYRFLVTGKWRLLQETQDWLAQDWIKRYPPSGKRGLALWERTDGLAVDSNEPTGLSSTPSSTVIR